MEGKTAVIKLGGHFFPLEIDLPLLERLSGTVRDLHGRKLGLILVTGGGETARKYIGAARRFGADETTCDQIGIAISRVNAQILIASLGDIAYPQAAESLYAAKSALAAGKVVVMGGLTPGQSTTAVGGLAAEFVGAELYVIATDVDGVYTADPKKDKAARRLESVTTREMLKMALEGQHAAGTYNLDPLAIKVIERSRLRAVFLDGRDPENIKRAVLGEKVGTQIVPV